MGKFWRWVKNKLMSPCVVLAHQVEDSSRSLDMHQPIHNVQQLRKRLPGKRWSLKRAWPFSSSQYQRQAAATVIVEEQEDQFSSNAVARSGLELIRVDKREEGKPKDVNDRQEEMQRNQPYSAMHERKNSQTLLAAAVTAVEAAMAAAQVVDQVTRLIGDGAGATNFMNISSSTPLCLCSPSPSLLPSSYSKEKEMATIKIQSFCRGYLVQRALKTLKPSVRLQALVRGYSAQQQAASAMRCIQGMMKVHAQVQARRLIFFPEGEDEVNFQSRLWQKHDEEDIIEKFAESSVDIEIPSMMTMVDTGAIPNKAEINSSFNAGQQRRVPTFRFDHPSSRSGAIFLEKQGSVSPVSKKSKSNTAAKLYGSGSPGRHRMADKVKLDVPSWIYSSSGESGDDRHAGCSATPSYMAATLSARAKYFSLNSTTAKQWFKRIEKETLSPSPSPSSMSSPSVKKRLSFSPINPRCGNTSPGRRCPTLPIKGSNT